MRWSPFASSGGLKPSLKVKTVNGGCGDIGYTYVGGIGYRCGFGNYLLDACFRDGPNPTEFVICVNHPWDTSVIRLHSPHLLLYPGVTFTAAATDPWGIVLDDGNRCGVVQGAHDVVRTRAKTYTVDYFCERGNLVLLREGIERGQVWQVNAARWSGKNGYTFLGHVPVRRVYFGTLPPEMERQNVLANKAYNAAVRVIHRSTPKAHLDLAWVRLALPQADWAYVIFTPADASFRGYFALLRLVGGRWQDASPYAPYCTTLPKPVREQLFLPKSAGGVQSIGHRAPRRDTLLGMRVVSLGPEPDEWVEPDIAQTTPWWLPSGFASGEVLGQSSLGSSFRARTRVACRAASLRES